MAQNTIERKLGELSFESGGTSTLELPRSHYYERLNLLVDWDVTVDATGGSFNELGIADLIKEIRVQINGNQTLKSTSFGLSHEIDKYQYGTRPVYDEPDLSTASNQTGQMQTFVDFTITPDDFAAMLPAFQTSDAVLTINWGTSADVSADVTVNDATVQVLSKERVRESVAGTQTKEKKVLNALMAFKEREKSVPITTTGTTPIELPRGNVYYSVPFMVFDGGSPSNDLIDSFAVKEDGVTTHRETTFDLARSKDKQEYGIENLTDGLAYVNFGKNGDLTDVIPTAGIDKFELLPENGSAPSDPAKIRLVTQELIR